MNQDDLMAARDARRYLERRPIDSTLAVVTSSKGYITVSGIIRALRSQPTVDVDEELVVFQKMVMRNVRDVRAVVVDARIRYLEKKEKHDSHDEPPSGPHLPGHGKLPPGTG